MTHANKIEILGSFGLAFLLILGMILFHEFGKETITEEEDIELVKEFCQHEYDSVLTKIQTLNVGDVLTKDNVLKYTKHSSFYGIWGDVKSQEKDNAMYEIKGGFNGSQAKYVGIEWRYYIKTENNKIVSIVKGNKGGVAI